MSTYVLKLSDPQATLENVGGKGMSLAKMINAGFPIPDGFHITTEAYRMFVAVNNLQTKILAALKNVDVTLPATLETASAAIGRFFAESKIPNEISSTITAAYLKPDTSHLTPVAVRSSATAEDLSEASFAGQQETFLNIRGEDDLLDAVKKCWASLWTARAIAYRIKNNIDQTTVALAVVVQEMVDAKAAGILFTANPINGHRDEMVINAAWGLGEAIVGGLVSPDTIIADRATGKVKNYEVAEKTVITVRTEKGTSEEQLTDSRRSSKVLNEAQVGELVEIARRIESHYGKPQDIEWCRAEGKFFIVQSRPITAMAEVPIEWTLPDPKGIYMRTSIADLMPSPLSPLFATWAMPTLTDQMKPLCIRMGLGEPVWPENFYTSINRYAYLNAAYPPKTWLWMIFRMLPAYPRLLRNMVPIWRDELHPEYQEFVSRYQAKDSETMTTSELWQDAQAILGAAMYYAGGLLYATMGASAGSEGLLTQVYNKFAKQEGDPEANVLMMGWDNIPVRSEKSLYDIAVWAREDDKLSNYILDIPSHELVGKIEGPDSVSISSFAEFTSRFNAHLEKFGHLVFQMDFAEPLPRDHPEMLLETIKMFLRGEGVNPHERQHASEEKRIQTAETMRNRLKGFKRWAFIKALNWGQSMAKVREDALAEIGLGYPILRAILYELGVRFVTAGTIQQANDIYWLEKAEVDACVHNLEQGNLLDSLSARVEERKAFNKRIGQETPPPMMPMKKRYLGIDTKVWLAESESNRTGNILKGVPTSSGITTAPARVLRGPEDFDKMRAGEVLVAGTTTPAWTPLFAMASAVVTDIGGPLSHGSIVAREYGIPAVMGTGVATRRVQSGQVITVDGNKGEVILETSEEAQPDQVAPPTSWKLPKGAYAVMRNNIVELMADPLSPLFATLGLDAINTSLPRMMNESLGLRGIMPDESIIVVNKYAYNNGSVSAKGMVRLLFNMRKITRMMFTGAVERWTEHGRPRYFEKVREWNAKDWHSFSSEELVRSARQLTESAIDAYVALVSGVIPAAWITEAVFTNVYNRTIKRRDDPTAPTYLLGFDSLPIRADKSLYSLAEWARAYPALAQCLERTPTPGLVALCESGDVPGDVVPMVWDEWRMRFHEHLRNYGHMLYDLDFIHHVPADDPAPVLDALKLYLNEQGVNPYTRQCESAERREQAVETIRQRLKGSRLKWFNKYLASAQKYAPLREDGLAEIGLAYPLIRQMLREVGNRFAKHNVIPNADEIFWLTQDEVLQTATRLDSGQSVESLAKKIPYRKAEHQAALSVRPPMMLPQMKIFGFDMMSLRDKRGRRNRGDVIKGVAASPGVTGGVARVLHGPEDFGQMKPGDVLVAPITTPAWTPLFAMASAVVTDIGGPLSHGSIVAREYGIPAVLGTGVATKRIHSGDTVEVNGSEGKVSIRARGSSTDETALVWSLPHPKAVLARGSFAEFVPEPVSPLFATLAVPIACKSTRDLMAEFGVTGENNYLFEVLNNYVYVGFVFTPRFIWQMLKASFQMLGPIMRTAAQRAVKAREQFISVVKKWQVRDLSAFTPTELLAGTREIFTETALFYNMAQSGTIPTAMMREMTFGSVYKMLVKRKSDPKAEVFVFGSENQAIRSEKALFDLATWAKEIPELADYLTQTPSDRICSALQTDLKPDSVLQEFASRFDSYLREYGHAIYDLDFTKPTPADDPAPLLETLKVYLTGKNNPHERQQAALDLREKAAETITKRLDPLRRRWFVKLLKSAQDTTHMREDSIADMGLGHPQIRRMLGELGKRLVARGAIVNADDIYWLEAQELDALTVPLEQGKALKNFSAEVECRKAKWEEMRHIVPPNTLPQKTWLSKFYADNEQASDTIKGFAASTGKVTARACVMLGPEDFSKMHSGDVIVAGITTPAWTPLFARASAIVTDIGGPLSHSSIVAREYGIPAVLATGVGTRRIQDGQTITVDGSAGIVSLN